ncbi:MAG: TylF/MycF/NovP-related O-methyltransferase [Pseudomonadota bacterium]
MTKGENLAETRIEGDAPEQSYKWLRRFLPAWLQPVLRGLRKRLAKEGYRADEPFCHIYHHTQVSIPRQDFMLAECQRIVAEGIEGSFVECGVLDGGTAALMAWVARGEDRDIELFDAWQGMPPASPEDGPGAEKWVGEIIGSPRRVEAVLRRVGARAPCIKVNRGWFDETLPISKIERIAFLHVDCDFYEPVKLVLETFVPRIASGGVVQIDDYQSFEGCRVAVNEYLTANPQFRLEIEDRPAGAIYFRIP